MAKFEHIKIDGRGAVVAYLDANLNPVDKRAGKLALIKVLFDDGHDVLWLTVQDKLKFKD